MIALLSVSAFFLTISYVFSEIMGAALSVERDELSAATEDRGYEPVLGLLGRDGSARNKRQAN
jgi:hypothetical protein